MGYECGFVKMPKYKDLSGNQISAIDSYIQWERYNVGRENPVTLKQYSGFADDELPDKEAIEYFKNTYRNKDFIETLEYWCSIGRRFSDWFVERLNDGVDDCKLHRAMTKQDIEDAIEYVDDYLKRNKLSEWTITGAYKRDGMTGVLSVIPCDGIEVEDDEGHIIRIDKSELIYYSKHYEDEEIEAFKSLKEVLTSMLLNIDFEKEQVFFFTSW